MRVQVIQERWRCTFEDEVSKVESADPGVKMVLRSSVDIRRNESADLGVQNGVGMKCGY